MRLLNKVAAILALAIGAMAVFAGGKTLLVAPPGYTVIGWLPVYNLLAGLVSATLVASLIWKNHRLALPAALVTLGAHSFVMLILQLAYRQVVAQESLVAVLIRIMVWVIIAGLLLLQGKRQPSARRLA